MTRLAILAAIVLALLAAGWWAYSAAVAHGRALGAAGNAQALADAQAAHAQDVAALRESIAACEAGRVVDDVLQRAALAAHASRADSLRADAQAARARLAAALATPDCARWAKEAACGL